jgi:O-antigen/teichoic acid export membrane protein
VENSSIHNTKTLQARIVSGSVVLLSGSGLTSAINLAYNLVIARYLGPTSFGHATVVYTLLTLLSAVTLSYQIVCSKIVAQQQSEAGKVSAYRMFHRSAWGCGLAIALVLLVFQSGIAEYLNLPDPLLVALLAIGAAFYVPLGSRRGYIQGIYGFRRLATNVVAEGAVRLGGSFLLVVLGFGVRGVIGANAAAVAVAYFVIPPKITSRAPSPLGIWNTVLEMSQALFFFAGQVLINNCDIVLVKHLFSAREAGLYSAIAMVGRVIFSFSSAVVNTTFPLVAGTRSEERKDFRVIGTSLLIVFTIGSVLAVALYCTPPWIWSTLFGSGFQIAGKYNLSYLQALYAFKTVIYSLSVVIITYEMSYKIANTSWVQLLFSGVLIEAIYRFHSSLRQVILLQIDLIFGLLILVAIPFLIEMRHEARQKPAGRGCTPIRVIRKVSEDAVIAEFLKSDFHRPEFQEYRESLGAIVACPNLNDPAENAKRRALLFRRHLSLWAEVPGDTSWFEVEVNYPDIHHVRVFPRAQWRKLARGNYSVTEIADRVLAQRGSLPDDFMSKIDRIAGELACGRNGFGAVILIGRTETEPVTVLDGNHRLVAALHGSPGQIVRLRFMCGLSNRMKQCCWYHTSFLTLLRYGWHVFTRAVCGWEPEIARMLEASEQASEADRGNRGIESEAVQVLPD